MPRDAVSRTANVAPSYTPGLVEVVEGAAELCELLLGDALGVPGQDLVLHLVDGAVDRGEELLPSNAQGFHGELRVSGGRFFYEEKKLN